MGLSLIVTWAGVVSLFLAAFGVSLGRVNLYYLGWAFLALAVLIL